MYWRDHNPPHFHAMYGGEEAQVVIDDCRVLAGSLPRTALKLVDEWAALHRRELLNNRYRAQECDSLVSIPGLR